MGKLMRRHNILFVLVVVSASLLLINTVYIEEGQAGVFLSFATAAGFAAALIFSSYIEDQTGKIKSIKNTRDVTELDIIKKLRNHKIQMALDLLWIKLALGGVIGIGAILWYYHPDNGRIEPLTIVITVVLGAIVTAEGYLKNSVDLAIENINIGIKDD